MPEFTREIEIMAKLGREAGQAILRLYRKEISIAFKNPNDPVTEADRVANAILVAGLSQHFPQDTIVAEESPLPPQSLHAGRVWYVDPLDGTKEFVAGNGEFSVMIGLAIEGRSQCGVVYWPTRDDLFAGISHQGAWRETQGHQFPLCALHATDPHSLTLIASRSHRPPRLDQCKRSLHITKEQSMGSVGLKAAQIAEGRADLYVDLNSMTRAWDACAPEAILRGAGGAFTDAHGHPLHYGTPPFRNQHGLVATTGDCHSRVISVTDTLCSCQNG